MNILEEIQNCPVEWKVLKDVAILKNGKDWKTLPSGEVPVYGSGGEMGEFVSDYSYDKPTVLIPRKGSISNLFYLEKAFWNVDTIYYTEIDENKIIPKYFYYYLTTVKLEEMATNPTRPSLTQAILDKVKIPVPPIKIQEKIVQILDKMTDYVTKLTSELTSELTSRKKQYSFYRDKLLSFEDEVYQVEWKTILDVSKKVTSGGTPDRSNSLYYGGSIPWLRTQEVDFREIYGTELSITEEGLANSSAKWIEKNAVIVAMYGATAAKVGIAKIPLTTNQACCNIEVDEDIANYRYVYHWLTYNYEALKSMGQGSQSNINAGVIKSFKIPVPSLEIQSRIVQVLDNFDMVCNDLNIGLPKEIELRQKQYEYFRDKLLTFVAEGEYTDSTVQYRQDIIRLLNWVFGPIRVELGSICEFVRGNGLQKKDFTQVGRSVIHYGQIYTKYDFTVVHTFSKTSEMVFKKLKKAQPNDLVMATTSENVEDVGKAIVWEGKEEIGISGDSYIIRTSQNSRYLNYWLRSISFQSQKERKVTGTKVVRINSKDMEKFQIVIPSLAEQERIVSILDNFNTLTNSLSEGLPKEIELRHKQYEYWREQLLNFTR